MSRKLLLAAAVMWCAPVQGQSRPAQGSYFEGTSHYSAHLFTNEAFRRLVIHCQADFWFTVDEQGKIKGEGLAKYHSVFGVIWTPDLKKRFELLRRLGGAGAPDVTMKLDPSSSTHEFTVSGELVPDSPPARPGGKPEPPKVKLKFAFKGGRKLRLIEAGTAAGSSVPISAGQRPDEGSARSIIEVSPPSPFTKEFGGDELTMTLAKDSSSKLYAGNSNYDGPGPAANTKVVVNCRVRQEIDYAAARNPANAFVVSPVGNYEGYVDTFARYFTDRPYMGMILDSKAGFWLAIDEKGKVKGEVSCAYTFDFGIDWTLAKKTGFALLKALGLPLDPSVTIALDYSTARQRFAVEGELLASPGAPLLSAPDEVKMRIRLAPSAGARLRLFLLGELSGGGGPSAIGMAAATALGRVVKQTIEHIPPPPFATGEIELVLKKRTPYGPYALVFQYDRGDAAENRHFVVTALAVQKPILAELSPCPKDWVPDLNTSRGTRIPFESRLVGWAARQPAQWRFTIEETSQLPGMCNNANMPVALIRQWENKINNHSADLLFDFRRYNGSREPRFRRVEGPPWFVLETREPTAEPVRFDVSCLDFGAYGRLIAEADFGQGWVRAMVRQTSEPVAHIPWAPNARQAERHMALSAKTWRGEPNYVELLPDKDDDNTPLGRRECRGDGLNNFEEYRGFYVREENNPKPVHRRLDPDQKDLFIFVPAASVGLLAPHLKDFQRASGLDVHRVSERFFDRPTRVANFNSGDRANKPQCGLLLRTGRLDFGLLGICNGDFGPPANVEEVIVDTTQTAFLEEDPRLRLQTKHTVVHELGHAVGMRHHGQTNYEIKEMETLTVDGQPILDDDGQPIVFEMTKLVAREGGQHSGNSDCAMKYFGASYYQHIHVPNSTIYDRRLSPYDPRNRETLGFKFCAGRTGTGLNDRSLEDWHCGDATEGICQTKIFVNDRCGGGAGGDGGLRRGSASKRNVPPDDVAERSARDSQTSHGLGVEVTLNGGASQEIVPGETAVLTLCLRHLASQEEEIELAEFAGGKQEVAPADTAKPVTRIGSAAKPWRQNLELLVLNKEKRLVPAPARLQTIGKVMRISPRRVKGKEETFDEAEYAEPQLAIKPGISYRASLAMDGADTAKLPAGELRLFVRITEPAGDARGERPEIISNSVLLTVKSDADLPPEGKRRAAFARKLSKARVAFLAERFKECETLARELIAEMPGSLEAHLLLAECLERQENLPLAYVEYHKSLACFKHDERTRDEPPQAIVLALRRLERKLGIKRRGIELKAEPGSIVSASLIAEAGREIKPPFPPTAKRIVFRFELAGPATKEPLQARWVAADTSGAMPANSLLGDAKSEPGKTAGQFELKPKGEIFDPGQYRLELHRGGKQLYVVNFEIRDTSK